MVFTSQIFLFVFFPLCMAAYLLVCWLEGRGKFGACLIKIRVKDIILICFSLAFYMWACFDDLFKLIFYILVVYILAHWINVSRQKRLFIKVETENADANGCDKRLYLAVFPFVLAITVLLFCLIYFKYADFIIGIWNQVFHTTANAKGVAAPLGLSFITFSAISYLADIYRGGGNGRQFHRLRFLPDLFSKGSFRTDCSVERLSETA